MKPNELKKLEAGLSQLETRRTELAAEHSRAATAEQSAQADFIAGKVDGKTIADAGARATSLAAALDKIDGMLVEKRREVGAAREIVKAETTKNQMAELAKAATAARLEYEARFQKLDALLSQHVPELLEPLRSWAQAQREWARLARELCPSFTSRPAGVGADEVGNRQRQAEAMLRELSTYADTSDIRADIGSLKHDYFHSYDFPETEFAGAIQLATQVVGNRPESNDGAAAALPKAA